MSDFFHLGPEGPLSGLDPQRRSYFSLASFSDPDGNSWLLQEITTRLRGRIDPGAISFGSISDLSSAFRRAETAHGEHEKRTGQRDAKLARLVRPVHGRGADRRRVAAMNDCSAETSNF